MNEIKRFLNNGNELVVYFDNHLELEQIVDRGYADTLVFSNEFGFSPLETNLELASQYVGISDKKIADTVIDYSHNSPNPTILGVKSWNLMNPVKGLIIASSEKSYAYSRYATPYYGKPYRDFYYILTYESLYYADHVLNSKNIGFTHLTCGGNYSFDVGMSQGDAIRNYFNNYAKTNIESVLFWGCCHEEYCFNKFHWLDDDIDSKHREVPKRTKKIDDFDLIEIHLKKKFINNGKSL